MWIWQVVIAGRRRLRLSVAKDCHNDVALRQAFPTAHQELCLACGNKCQLAATVVSSEAK